MKKAIRSAKPKKNKNSGGEAKKFRTSSNIHV